MAVAGHCKDALGEIAHELRTILGYSGDPSLDLLQHKRGIYVCRAMLGEQPVIAKYYVNAQARRELGNYRLLHSLGVPTIMVIGMSARCLVLEDLVSSHTMRLGTSTDLHDEQIAVLMARWYRTLHQRGATYAALDHLYAETDMLTVESLAALQTRFPQAAETWEFVRARLADLHASISALPVTLTYNDFHWTNLAVARDGQQALLFDLHLLGRGYRYADVRNVCSALSPESGSSFLAEYGPVNCREAAADAFLAPLISLISACTSSVLPSWAVEALRAAQDGSMRATLLRFLEDLPA